MHWRKPYLFCKSSVDGSFRLRKLRESENHQLMLTSLSSGMGSSRENGSRHRWKREVGKWEHQWIVFRPQWTGLFHLDLRSQFSTRQQQSQSYIFCSVPAQGSSWKSRMYVCYECTDQDDKSYYPHCSLDVSRRKENPSCQYLAAAMAPLPKKKKKKAFVKQLFKFKLYSYLTSLLSTVESLRLMALLFCL